jgi:cysteine desulfurase
MDRIIYLDNNSTTRVDKRVIDKMLPYFNEYYGNASSMHIKGWEADEAVQQARLHTADLIGASKNEIYFTSGSTEAINIALRGIAMAHRNKGNHIVTCLTEHKAVLDTCNDLFSDGFTITYLPVNREGIINPDDLREAIKDETILVALMHGNNETGVIHPVAEAGEICKEKKVIFFCDATQSAGKVPVDVNDLNCDLLCFSAHKFYGPKGVGALYIKNKKPRLSIKPVYTGGGHELGIRPGTLNVPGIAGMGEACRIAKNEMLIEGGKVSALRTLMEQQLQRALDTRINGSIKNRLPNTTNILFNNVKASQLISSVPVLSFSTGSACTSALQEPSHVLKAMSLSDAEVYSSARFSLGRFTTEEDISTAVSLLTSAVKKLISA